ncbi:MAG: S41 family peptidase, partial [Bacteroidota bacterium]
RLVIDLRNNTGGNSKRINYLFSYLTGRKFQFCERAVFTGPTKSVAGESAKERKRRANGAVTKRERRLQKALTKQLKPKKSDVRFNGKVAVLINEISFSASGMFARFVQGSGRGILVGTTSGASANITYGASTDDDKNYYGPQNDFRLRINSIMLELPRPIPGNVTPDFSVTPTPAGLRAGKDEVLEAALSALQK